MWLLSVVRGLSASSSSELESCELARGHSLALGSVQGASSMEDMHLGVAESVTLVSESHWEDSTSDWVSLEVVLPERRWTWREEGHKTTKVRRGGGWENRICEKVGFGSGDGWMDGLLVGWLVGYLGFESVFLAEGGFEVGFELEVAGVEHFVVALELFSFPAGAAVLEPDGDLAGLQAELLGQLHFALGLQLVLHLEVALQRAHLVEGEAALLLHWV